MKLSELIHEVGDENIQFQWIAESMSGAKMRNFGVTEISFLTNAVTCIELCAGQTKKVGVVVWMPAELFDKARNELLAKSELAKGTQ